MSRSKYLMLSGNIPDAAETAIFRWLDKILEQQGGAVNKMANGQGRGDRPRPWLS
jgi:hypothetical protein